MQDPAAALRLQFLTWLADGGKSYGEVMQGWRTSCPRLSIWEDAVIDGLVRIDGSGSRTQAEARVTLTSAGRALLDGEFATGGQSPDRGGSCAGAGTSAT